MKYLICDFLTASTEIFRRQNIYEFWITNSFSTKGQNGCKKSTNVF